MLVHLVPSQSRSLPKFYLPKLWRFEWPRKVGSLPNFEPVLVLMVDEGFCFAPSLLGRKTFAEHLVLMVDEGFCFAPSLLGRKTFAEHLVLMVDEGFCFAPSLLGRKHLQNTGRKSRGCHLGVYTCANSYSIGK